MFQYLIFINLGLGSPFTLQDHRTTPIPIENFESSPELEDLTTFLAKKDPSNKKLPASWRCPMEYYCTLQCRGRGGISYCCGEWKCPGD